MDLWMKKYEYAKEFFEKNGHLRVPKNYKTEDGFGLFDWLINQRRSYKNRFVSSDEKNNKYATMTDEQVELLNNIGMIWDICQKNWMDKYNEAKKYYEKYGNVDIKYGYKTKNGLRLGAWISTQRQAYNNRFLNCQNRKENRAPLTDEQVKLLESIGMNWDMGKNEYSRSWIKMYKLAKKYYKKNGNLLMGTYYKTKDGVNLGAWIHHQRQAYKNRFIDELDIKNKSLILTDEQIVMLERIGMVWSANEYQFVNEKITERKKIKLEKRFLEFLSDYIKENKSEFQSYEDVKKIEDAFIKTLGSAENHYSPLRRR